MKRKFLKVAGIAISVVLILLVSVIAYVYTQQGKLVQKALGEFNETIEGHIKLEKSKLVFFKNFPYISVDLKNLEVYQNEQDAKPLLQVSDLYVGFNFWKLIQGNFEIKKIKIAKGHIHITALEEGNYDLMQALGVGESEDKEEEVSPLQLSLKSLVIKEVTIKKTSEYDKTEVELQLKDIKAKLKKSSEELFAKLKADVLISLSIGDSVWAKDKRIELDSELTYDQIQDFITVQPSKLRYSGVSLAMEGTADVANDLDLDLKIQGDKEDFALLFAFLPNEYQIFMKRYKNAGKIFFDASIKGKSINGYQPLVEANFGCKQGYFENINVRRTLKDLNFSAYFTNGEERNLSTSEFRLNDFNALPEQGLVKANFIIKNFEDPYVNLTIDTDFDLNFIAEFFQLDNIEQLKGKVLLSVNYNELVDVSQVENTLLGFKQGVDSKLSIENLEFRFPNYPYRFKNINVLATMKDGRLSLDNFGIQVNTSDIQLSGYISSLPALLHSFDQNLEIGLNISSNLIDLKALTTYDTTKFKPIDEKIMALKTGFKFVGNAKELQNFSYLPKGKFELTDLYAELENFPHKLHDFDATIIVGEKDLTIDRFHAEIDKTDFDFQFKIANYSKWFKDSIDGFSKIAFALRSNNFYPNDLLTYQGVNYLPEDLRKENIKNLYLKGALQLNYIENALDSFAIEFEESKGNFSVYPLKIERLKGIVYGRDGILSTRNLQVKLGNSDALLSMKYHYGEAVKDRSNYFKFRSNYLDFDQLTAYESKAKIAESSDSMAHHEEAFNVFELPFSNTRIDFEIAKLNYHRIKIDNFNAKARLTQDKFLHVDTLYMDLAGGHIDLKGYFNGSDSQNIYFSPQFRIKDLDMNQVLIKVDNFGQEMLVNDNLKGRLSGTLEGKIKMYPDLFPVLEKSDLKLNIEVVDGVFVNFAPLRAMSSFFRDRNLNYVRFDTLRNEFTIKNGELNIPAMTINSSLGYLEISGRQSLELDMNYLIRVPWSLVSDVGASKLFGGRRKSDIPEDQVDEIIRRDETRRGRFITVRLTGNPDDFNVNLGRGRNNK